MTTQFEVGEIHPDACLEGWWFGVEANVDTLEFRIPDLQAVHAKESRSRPIIYICKDKRVVFVADTVAVTFHQDFFGFAEALAAANTRFP